jgi:hypothetical protein
MGSRCRWVGDLRAVGAMKIKLKLKHPIPIPTKGGGVMMIDKLKMRNFKPEHLKFLPEDFAQRIRDGQLVQPDEFVTMVSLMCEIPRASAEQIDFEDLQAISAGLSKFCREEFTWHLVSMIYQ